MQLSIRPTVGIVFNPDNGLKDRDYYHLIKKVAHTHKKYKIPLYWTIEGTFLIPKPIKLYERGYVDDYLASIIIYKHHIKKILKKYSDDDEYSRSFDIGFVILECCNIDSDLSRSVHIIGTTIDDYISYTCVTDHANVFTRCFHGKLKKELVKENLLGKLNTRPDRD